MQEAILPLCAMAEVNFFRVELCNLGLQSQT